MRKARIMGRYIKYLSDEKNITVENLSQKLGCSEMKVYELFKGLVYPSFSQLSCLAELFDVTVEELINGRMDIYRENVVHCMNDFQDEENREKILDIIENYVDILNSAP